MKQAAKEWFSLLPFPAILITHYYTQWQGLLNVLGVVLLLTLALVLFSIWAVFMAAQIGDEMAKAANAPKAKRGAITRYLAIIFTVSGAIYLLWTGHMIVGMLAILNFVAAHIFALLFRVMIENE